MIADVPKIKKTLNMFDPTIFPIAISTFFFRAAITDVASSGNDVPIEIIVKEIIRSEIPNMRAISVALYTIALPPNIKNPIPIMIKSIAFLS